MNQSQHSPKRPWSEKFGDAFRGLVEGTREQSSFVVHFLASALVLVAAVVLRADRVDWCLLLLCITVVLGAEMINSALELLARAITDTHDENVGTALDIGSAAVLTCAVGASLVGAIILGHLLGERIGWW